ncbi:Putative queuosine salvage protein family [Septoria linicola]|uniref:Queuosine 5'-phosphate N-glycosylase/hydrolase n=1 Tax=Septoria linicola TaxID=215465 RepID=A0A9Q9B688_9PEZI|nr:Putative queuosine salvage protein family [Septoria linicola]
MSDDEADPELLELLRQRLGISSAPQDGVPRDTGVLKNAEFIYSNSIDVHVDMYGTKGAASHIYKAMQERGYSTQTWSAHELHPKPSEGFSEVDIVNFVFTMDLLNFSFWSELSNEERFQVEYRTQRWTGYNSLVACLRRALDEGIPFTTPRFWSSPRCTAQLFAYVFRSATAEPIPLLEERITVLKEASNVLREYFADDDGDDSEEESDLFEDAQERRDPNQMEKALTADANQQLDNVTVQQQDVSSDPAESNLAGAIRSSHTTAEISDPNVLPEISTSSVQLDDSTLFPTNVFNAEAENEPIETNGIPATASGEGIENGTAAKPAADLPFVAGIIQVDLRPDHAVTRLIEEANQSAGKLVNLLAKHFDCFRDETRFDGRKVRLLKRAQIFVADLWAALNCAGYGRFDDIDHLTMFADYRVPQSLHSLGVLTYSPPLDYHIRNLRALQPGHTWEVQLRGCSIWAVELIRREILQAQPDTTSINAVLIDFFLYDLAKEREAQGQHAIPHHRTRSIWY